MIKDDFLQSVETRFKTLMIGGISRFEKYFGYLWNHGDEPTTVTQQKFRDLWEDLRIDLLNHGNNQIRLALEEIYQELRRRDYKYNYKFFIKDKEE